jgi:D-glycero-alpha-D-manno-heptose-7-phosphate kinase
MSFVGGGSDIPSFYRRFGGAVVSTAIDRYVYVTVNQKFDNAIRVSYSKTEEVDSVEQIRHKIVRETMKYLNVQGGVEITTIADVPSSGTGLGSSSAFTIGLLHALNAYNRAFTSAETLARDSCKLEIEICGEPIGKQDQYASAYGGLNFIRFNEDDSVSVDPIICLRETLERLQRNTLVFYTGITRGASALLKVEGDVLASDQLKQDAMKRMVKLAHDLRDELQRNNLDSFGEILHENWCLKRSITDQISTADIDGWYEKARSAGALGGKLLGAGGGGFLSFYAPYEKHHQIERVLPNLRKVNFGLERQGSKIIFVH